MDQFKQILQVNLAKITPVLRSCHTIWIFGTGVPITTPGTAPPSPSAGGAASPAARPPPTTPEGTSPNNVPISPSSEDSVLLELEHLAAIIIDHCQSAEPALVIHLEQRDQPSPKGPARVRVQDMYHV